jgi:co-chaperonin GroES (HSP10)
MAKKSTAFSKHDISEFRHEFAEQMDDGQGKRVALTSATNVKIKSSVVHEVIVKVDQRLVDEIKTGKTTLFKDPSYDVYKNTKICAEVVAVPVKLKGTVLYEEDPGFPQPQGRKDRMGNYTQTTHQRSFKTLEGTDIRVRVGDKIYFHYLTLTDQNYLGKDPDGMELYKCGYEQIFCYVRDEEVVQDRDHKTIFTTLTMLNGWVAVKPYFDESYEPVEIPELDLMGNDTGKTRTLRVKQSESGIIYDMNEKPMYRHGEIWSLTMPSPDGKDYGLAAGDKIVYNHNMEFKNTIEGEDYYIMKLWNIVGKYVDNSLVPVGDRVLIDTLQLKESRIIIPDHLKPKPHDATI